MNIKELLTNRIDGNMLGDRWANERVEIVFKDIDLETDKRFLTEQIFNFVKYLKSICHNGWIQDQLTKSEAKNLNAILKCKTKETLRKKISKFYGNIQQDRYDFFFHVKKINAWKEVIIALQEKEHLWEEKIKF